MPNLSENPTFKELRERFFQAYFPMLPGMLATAVMTAALPLGVQKFFFAMVLSPFLFAAAAKAYGIQYEQSYFGLLVERAGSHTVGLIFLLVVMCVPVGLSILPPLGLAPGTGLNEDLVWAPFVFLFTLVFMMRLWPVVAVSYLCESHHGSIHWRTRAWMGPGSDPNGRTVCPSLIHCAISDNGDLEVVRLLLEAGADVNFSTERGYSPLVFAKTEEMANFLRRYGCRE